jgi:hypothetical protein
MRSREPLLVSSTELIRTKMIVLSSSEQLAPFKLFLVVIELMETDMFVGSWK